MSNNSKMDPMLQIYISETTQQVEAIELAVLNIEKNTGSLEPINEIFRLMHSIKGSSAMMLYNNIATVAHAIEDLFDYIKKNASQKFDFSQVADIVLEVIDFIKSEIIKIENNVEADGDSSEKEKYIKEYLRTLKKENHCDENFDEQSPREIIENSKFYIPSKRNVQSDLINNEKKENFYEILVTFEDDCKMENVRAFALIHELGDISSQIRHYPEDIIDDDNCVEIIKNEGIIISLKSEKTETEIKDFIFGTGFIKEVNIKQTTESDRTLKNNKFIILDDYEAIQVQENIVETVDIKDAKDVKDVKEKVPVEKQGSINVNIYKLDKLMDLVGELVISEAMVTRNPDLDGLSLDRFNKAARQLRKITNDIQDIVNSIRMVPLALTFQKMNRIVRDMSRQLNKEVSLEILGEDTEVDKNIIEHLSDPLMHIIRNALDHGIGTPQERIEKGKEPKGKIVLEGKNAGGDVWIIIRDDGKGLDKNKILQKAREKKLITKPEAELTDKEIYSFIFLPGFSTKENITEISGRGVGMDVVMKNIEKIRGTIAVDSTPDAGTVISVKIPLTLAIINGMIVRVGDSTYTVPTISIKESFKISENELITDTNGNEMILVRGACYPVVRLNELYNVKTNIKKIDDGIIMMIENENRSVCLFADALLGEQQVVVKALPKYINKVKGIAGCTLLGDGSISLILDAGEFIN